MFDHLSANYELGLILYVFTYIFLCIPIAYIFFHLRKEKRKQDKRLDEKR